MTGYGIVMQGDAAALELDDDSVDLVVTSPPYFGQRDYDSGDAPHGEQIGAEESVHAYLDHLVACTAEMARVVKPTGSIWVNLGDKFAGSPSAPRLRERARWHRQSRDGTFPHKSLLGVPWRYALAVVEQLGLVLRAEVIWDKPNAIPESTRDRVRKSHETWFHFVRQPRYFSAVDYLRDRDATKLSRMPGSVWAIPTEPLHVPDHVGVTHFAAFPTELPRRIIAGWSPSGVCTRCGEGRRPKVERVTTGTTNNDRRRQLGDDRHGVSISDQWQKLKDEHPDRIVGEECGCADTSAQTTPAVVLDPFGGTGTTALAAVALGRDGISVDRSADYCRLARWRLSDPGQLAHAMRVPKPEPAKQDEALFDL